jgi:hypothetical protein
MSLLLSPKCKSNLDSRGTRLFASASTTVGDAVSTARQGLINDLFKILMMCYPLKNGVPSKFRAKTWEPPTNFEIISGTFRSEKRQGESRC